VLADINWQGQSVPAVLLANRNGFFYALDRRTGRFLVGKPFAEQTWASGLTAAGRPIVRPGTDPTPGGTVVSPPLYGATSFWPPSFDPKRNLLYVPSVDSSDIFFDVDGDDYHLHRPFLGSGYVRAPDRPTTLALRAIDIATGQLRWNSTILVGGGEVPGEMGGVLSTEGGVLFAGHENEFDAYSSDTGAQLWSAHLGGVIHAPPVSYAVAGRQYVAVFSGRDVFAFALPRDEQGGAKASADAAHVHQPRPKTVHRALSVRSPHSA